VRETPAQENEKGKIKKLDGLDKREKAQDRCTKQKDHSESWKQPRRGG
jgi:hypothetical protein